MFKDLFNLFYKNQKQLYHVGGSVRDILLNKKPKDFDFATDANPQEIKSILTSVGHKVFNIGEKFGTISTILNNEKIEITTYRLDLTSGRHPDVKFTTNLLEDLSRRDFTINSMALNSENILVDPFINALPVLVVYILFPIASCSFLRLHHIRHFSIV
jgi:tRNA nucleotidyltransferase (CCA-adding enzyme)